MSIPIGQLQYILNHAKSVYPEECCGFLIGTNSEPRQVHRALAALNVAPLPKNKRYNIDPIEFVHADEEAHRSNLDLMGFYHSHPDAPVQPSQTDLENAWPFYTYLIVSLQDGEPRDVAVWLLRQDKVAFELDELQLF